MKEYPGMNYNVQDEEEMAMICNELIEQLHASRKRPEQATNYSPNGGPDEKQRQLR